jgi:hypothetical protein
MINLQMFFDQDAVASFEQALKRRLMRVNLERLNIDYSDNVIYPDLT